MAYLHYVSGNGGVRVVQSNLGHSAAQKKVDSLWHLEPSFISPPFIFLFLFTFAFALSLHSTCLLLTENLMPFHFSVLQRNTVILSVSCSRGNETFIRMKMLPLY